MLKPGHTSAINSRFWRLGLHGAGVWGEGLRVSGFRVMKAPG